MVCRANCGLSSGSMGRAPDNWFTAPVELRTILVIAGPACATWAQRRVLYPRCRRLGVKWLLVASLRSLWRVKWLQAQPGW